MTTIDFITELFCRVDDHLGPMTKHSQASLYPSEVITLGLLYALKGVGQRAFWGWLVRDYRSCFAQLPDRSRLFRLLSSHRHLVDHFLAEPSVLGVIDSYGIELLHPRREDRSPNQIGKKGKSNTRWIVGGKLCFVLNQVGLITAWDCDTANVHDGTAFQHLVEQFKDTMIIFADLGFRKVDWLPDNLRLCQRGEWNIRMIVETVLSVLAYVCQTKRLAHKNWDYFKTRLAYLMALFNILY